MDNNELIKQIKKLNDLKEIEPSQRWLDLTRYQLLGRIDSERESLKWRRGFLSWFTAPQFDALVVCLLIIFLGGPWLAVKATEASLPGEWLYSVKRASEEVKGAVTAETEKSQLQVEFAGRRLEELNRLTQKISDLDGELGAGHIEEVEKVMVNLKENLADASVYADRISPSHALIVAKKTKRIKEGLDKVKREIPENGAVVLGEAEKSIGQISSRILTVLSKEVPAETEATGTSTSNFNEDKEIITFLKETSAATTTEDNVGDNEPDSQLEQTESSFPAASEPIQEETDENLETE